MKQHLLARSPKWVLMIGGLFSAMSAFAEDPPIVGFNGNTVSFWAKEWTMPGVDSATAWFSANGKTFPLFGADIGADGHSNMLSPDKKTLLLDPVIFGMLSEENGEEKLVLQQHCAVISMETGCVLADRWATFVSASGRAINGLPKAAMCSLPHWKLGPQRSC